MDQQSLGYGYGQQGIGEHGKESQVSLDGSLKPHALLNGLQNVECSTKPVHVYARAHTHTHTGWGWGADNSNTGNRIPHGKNYLVSINILVSHLDSAFGANLI